MKTFPLFAAPLLLTLAFVALAPAASADCIVTPRVAGYAAGACVHPDSDVCPASIYHRTPWLEYRYCVLPVSDAAAEPGVPCVATPTVAETSTRVCADPTNLDCPVFVWQRQGWLSYGYCVPGFTLA